LLPVGGPVGSGLSRHVDLPALRLLYSHGFFAR
jgi:hypothetical protein